jgi:molybdopterin synthase sulfur carrier subunit
MKLVYFSWIRERLDIAEETVELPGSVETVADLIQWQKNRGETFQTAFEHDAVIRVALDQEHAENRSASLSGVGEIAFFPPMTGG